MPFPAATADSEDFPIKSGQDLVAVCTQGKASMTQPLLFEYLLITQGIPKTNVTLSSLLAHLSAAVFSYPSNAIELRANVIHTFIILQCQGKEEYRQLW